LFPSAIGGVQSLLELLEPCLESCVFCVCISFLTLHLLQDLLKFLCFGFQNHILGIAICTLPLR